MKCFECGDLGHKHFACPHKAGSTGVMGSNVAKSISVSSAVSEFNRFNSG